MLTRQILKNKNVCFVTNYTTLLFSFFLFFFFPFLKKKSFNQQNTKSELANTSQANLEQKLTKKNRIFQRISILGSIVSHLITVCRNKVNRDISDTITTGNNVCFPINYAALPGWYSIVWLKSCFFLEQDWIRQ